jgi:hypothetical protein
MPSPRPPAARSRRRGCSPPAAYSLLADAIVAIGQKDRPREIRVERDADGYAARYVEVSGVDAATYQQRVAALHERAHAHRNGHQP